ncbi:MAG: pyridoxal phosphate-dependent aminotransferase [Bacteroidota bacterium]
MRQRLLSEGANELSYEIRGIVKKAHQVRALGHTIFWENIGDPVNKHYQLPDWIKDIVVEIVQDNATFGYCDSKGVLETRQFLAELNNQRNGAQITADDVLFFNGLGDAISKLYQYLVPTSRVIGPSPSYSTHSSAEASHANHHPITYNLDPNNNWYPELGDMHMKIKYNPNIVGILLINPDNPTGVVYPRDILEAIVEIARAYNLFLVADEIYLNITYNGATAHALAEVIGEVPGISMKGISKELPWPGARCGWMEFYNRQQSADFDRYCATLENAKMIEVCSTKLPQLVIPKVMSDPRYKAYRQGFNDAIGQRSRIISELLQDIPAITFNPTYGAFYNTIIFRDGILKPGQQLAIEDPRAEDLLGNWFAQEPDMALDKRFVYYLLAAKGVCVVPISSFCSDLQGFRVTLLENDEAILRETFTRIREAVIEFTGSA